METAFTFITIDRRIAALFHAHNKQLQRTVERSRKRGARPLNCGVGPTKFEW
jgi:hypothetical protein